MIRIKRRTLVIILFTAIILSFAGCKQKTETNAAEKESKVSTIQTEAADETTADETSYAETSDYNDTEAVTIDTTAPETAPPQAETSLVTEYVPRETAAPIVSKLPAQTAAPSWTVVSPVTGPPKPVETAAPKPKSIYDFEFDIEAMREDLISLGEGMNLRHITEDEGKPITPDNASWAVTVTASESFQGANLERRLKDYVSSMPQLAVSYGGEPIKYFTIYTESLAGGAYTIYFLF